MRIVARHLIVFLIPMAIHDAARGQIAAKKFVVQREELCVTEGEVKAAPDGRFTVNATKMRAYVNTGKSQSVEARLTYMGPTAEVSKLGSGEVRQQFGLKLRAENACNLVYAMWRIEPESKLVVSVKSNPGQTTSSECGNRGYENLKPRIGGPVPPMRKGETHDLAAQIEGNELKVRVDGKDVWVGDLGPVAGELKGPVGIRSDNVQLDFELRAGELAGPRAQLLAGCKSGPGQSD